MNCQWNFSHHENSFVLKFNVSSAGNQLINESKHQQASFTNHLDSIVPVQTRRTKNPNKNLLCIYVNKFLLIIYFINQKAANERTHTKRRELR